MRYLVLQIRTGSLKRSFPHKNVCVFDLFETRPKYVLILNDPSEEAKRKSTFTLVIPYFEENRK